MNLRKRITDRIKVPMDVLTPSRRKPTKRFGIHIPSKPWGLSPTDSRSLPPVRFWRIISRRVRTSLPTFIQSYSSRRLITGLSSANNHRRSHSPEFFLFPSGVHQIPQHNISVESPAELSSKPQRSISSHRVIPRRVMSSPSLFPNGVIFSYRFILATIIPSGNEELYSSTSAQDSTNFPAFVKDLFSQTKIHSWTFHILYILLTYMIKCIRHNLIYFENIMTSCISYIMTLHTTDVSPFQEKGQSKDDYYQLS